MLNYEMSEKVADEILERLMNEHNCAWYVAFEDLGGYELMEEAGVCKEVIDLIAAEI